MNAPYPWLAAHWQRLAASRARGTLGHAYLIAGPEGLGKQAFAEAFARYVLCEAEEGRTAACGDCRSCRLYASASHPDLKRVTITEDHPTIRIDQVRELVDFFALKPHYQRRRIAIVHPADVMNRNAANALLKILEEPPPSALLILVCHRAGLLPPTVVSRCQRVNVTPPAWDERLAWLAEQRARQPTLPDFATLTLQGAPLTLLARLEAGEGTLLTELIPAMHAAGARNHDQLATARQFGGGDVQHFLDAFESVIQAMIQLCAGHAPGHLRLPEPAHSALAETAASLGPRRLFAILDEVARARGVVLRSSGVRGNEVIENLWFAWVDALRTRTTA
jgi:DNA polymerase-3 subunit delta'